MTEAASKLLKFLKPAEYDERTINTGICSRCGGRCCTSAGCHFSPRDFREEITVDLLRDFLDTGYVSLDWWVGDPRDDEICGFNGYYLRIKNVGCKTVDPSFGGKCMLNMMTPGKPCQLPYEYRPMGGRLLVPHENTPCVSEYTKQQCAIEWLSYHDMLAQLHDEFVEKGDYTDPVEASLAMIDHMVEESRGGD